MSTLQLTVPSIHEEKAVRVKPREVSHWLENLPFLDLQRTAPAIHQQLRLFNRQAMPPAQRLQILDAFRMAYSRLRQSRPGSGQALPFNLETLCKKLCQDLAFGYKLAINDLLNKKRIIGQKRLMTQAIGGALDCFSQHTTYFYATYQRTPRALWSEAVALYRYARDQGIDLQTVATSDGDVSSLQQIFTGMALLRLSDPYQLQNRAVWHLRRYFDRHAECSTLFDSSTPVAAGQSCLVVDNSDDVTAHVLLVNVTRLQSQMSNDLALLEQPKKPVIAGFPEEMGVLEVIHALKRVIATWNRMVERKTNHMASLTERNSRKSERLPVHQSLALAAGMSAIWYELNQQFAFDAKMFDPQLSHEIDLSQPVDDRIGPATRHFEVATCTTINRSTGGVALHVDLEKDMALFVGQLVALRRPDAEAGAASWIIAACRWLIERSGGAGADVGLQYLARDARPVAIRSRTGDSHRAEFIPAFAVTQKHQDTLITRAGVFRPDGMIDLYEHGRKLSLRCNQLLDACHGFERFIYKSVETA